MTVRAREHGVLDDHTAARFKILFADGLESIPVYIEQLARWERSVLTELERTEVIRLQGQIAPLKPRSTRGSPSPTR